MVIIVDENDVPLGVMPKLEAHEKAYLHRAFSVFIFNSAGELLMQKRAGSKYHSPLLWTNTCCSHPKPDQNIHDAAKERLFVEMGIKTDLEFILKFKYKSSFENGLTEHEIDHILVGCTNDKPIINPEEVSAYKYMSVNDIQIDVNKNPENYTTWFRIISGKFMSEIVRMKEKLCA